MTSPVPTWLSQAVGTFGAACKAKLSGPGDKEAAIRSPLETLLSAVGTQLDLSAVFHDEVRDETRHVRPDYGVSVDGAITGYVEVKAPGKSIDPANFNGHDRRQWERQRDLPNLLYTNGVEWRLYRDGNLVTNPITFSGGPLSSAGTNLQPPADFETLATDFLRWKPAPITSVAGLVRAVAPLTRLLRGEVLDQLDAERRAISAGQPEDEQPFLGLARDWRALLFPTASEEVFADGYAQAVTFALLLARTERIDLRDASLHSVGDRLITQHSLMGRALQLLTERVAGEFKVTLDLLVRVIGSVDWPRVRAGNRDTYLYLYESFLEAYDPALRRKSGSYYTPREVVEQMVRLTNEVLVNKLGKVSGFLDPDVLIVDPAMGTGTYLHAIIERVAKQAEAADGPGIVAGTVSDAARRLVGFELQMGPYAVAELRTTDLLSTYGATPPAGGMRTYVTNTLDDPNADVTQIASGLATISASRRRANEIKARTPVTVVIGNPPYRENAGGEGGWIEFGDTTHGITPALNDFRTPGDGVYVQNIKNLYVYFWRWATWKVFDAHQEDRDGVVCFITTSAYMSGPGFKGMREYLRRTCSEGWVIDLSPEGGVQPKVQTRVFPTVQQRLAIGIFVRRNATAASTPAEIRYTKLEGRRQEKFTALAALGLDGDQWRLARDEWQSPFTPAALSAWDDYPALGDMIPWVTPGIGANRTWVWAPSPEILGERWRVLTNENDLETKRKLFKETASTKLTSIPKPLPGPDTSNASGPIVRETSEVPRPVRMGYRFLDRQWLIPDSRVMHRARVDLWAARIPNQLFLVEMNSKAIKNGPAVVFSALVPDMHFFKGSEGGRVLPMLHPDESPNLAPGLLSALKQKLSLDDISVADVVAYVAGISAHPEYTHRFSDELTTPGVRVPLTTQRDLWLEAVALGRQVIWLQTYGALDAGGSSQKSAGIRYPAGDPRQPLSLTPITSMPDKIEYDAEACIVRVGSGTFGPVIPRAWEYEIDGKNVISLWFNYRKANPGGKQSSPLDELHVSKWPTNWTTEFIDLLTVLSRLSELEDEQASLLGRVLTEPTLTHQELAAMGVRWPMTKKDRKPRYSLESARDDEGELTLDSAGDSDS